jgi:hypothetical protein
MTFSRKLTSIATAAAIAVTSLGSMTTAASAHDRDGYRGDYGRSHDRHDGYRRDYGYRGGRDRYYARRKDHTGKYVAIGAAALMLGIIASEASRR